MMKRGVFGCLEENNSRLVHLYRLWRAVKIWKESPVIKSQPRNF